jgi:hypothetical protein
MVLELMTGGEVIFMFFLASIFKVILEDSRL